MAVCATYRRRLLGGRSASLCSEAQSSSSAAPSAPVLPPASAASQSSRGSAVNAAEEGNPVAILDRLSYILTLADRPQSALSVLQQILELVASPMARLCLRARGAFPRLLGAIHMVVQRSPSGECRLLQASILRYLSLDSAVRAELLDAALPDLLETLTLGMQSPLLPIPEQNESPSAEPAVEAGLLKRRRCLQQSPRLRRGGRLEVSGNGVARLESPAVTSAAMAVESPAVALVLKHLQAALTEAEYHRHVVEPCVDGVLLPLLVLRQCLRGQGKEARAHQNATSAASQSVLQAVLPMVLAEAALWQLQNDGRSPDSKLSTSRSDGLRLLLFLDVLEACVGCGASERVPACSQLPCLAAPADASSCLAHLCWQTLSCFLERSKNGDMQSPCFFAEITRMCLRLVFSLTQRHSFWVQLILQPLPRSPGDDAVRMPWKTRTPSVLAILLETLGTDMAADHPNGSGGQGVISRLALGILANLASQGMIERQTVAKHPVSADYPQRLLCGALSLGSASPREGIGCRRSEICAGDGVASLNFLEALALAFRERCAALSSVGDDGRPMLLPEVKGDTEACVTCAVAALLIGWLMHEDPEAHAAVKAFVGPTEFLVDLLRQFAVFQDHCGTLTDASLVNLHAVMLSVEAHIEPRVTPELQAERAEEATMLTDGDSETNRGNETNTGNATNTGLPESSSGSDPADAPGSASCVANSGSSVPAQASSAAKEKAELALNVQVQRLREENRKLAAAASAASSASCRGGGQRDAAAADAEAARRAALSGAREVQYLGQESTSHTTFRYSRRRTASYVSLDGVG